MHIRMSLEVTSDFSQGHHLFHIVEPSLCQSRIERRYCVSLGQHELIPTFHLRILRIDIHGIEIKRRKNVRCGQGTTRVARTGFVDCANDIHTNLASCFFQLIIISVTHNFLLFLLVQT